MLGKHTIFGASLGLNFVTKSTGKDRGEVNKLVSADDAFDYGTTTQFVWVAVKGTKDSTSKAEDKFHTSLSHTWKKEVTEAELVKASPWLK